jgi:hypothetical protein
MRITTNDAADAAHGPPPIDLEALVGDSDAQLVYEGLYRLREVKLEALQAVQAEGLSPLGQRFTAWDFGISQIDRLLARLGGAPAADRTSTPEQ